MRVLFTTIPGWGHVHPMVPLAKAMAERGDDVAWATAAEFVAPLEREGFEVMKAGRNNSENMGELDRRFPEWKALAGPDLPPFMFPRFFGAVIAPVMLADLMPLARAWQPTLMVREAAEFAGPIVAAALAVPIVTHALGTLRPPAFVAAASEFVTPLWEAQGLAPRPFGGSYDHLYLDIYPKSLRTLDYSEVGDVQMLRPVAFAAAGDDAELPDLVNDDSALPLVYVTFGTVFNKDAAVISTVVQGVAELGVRVVVTVGPAGDPASLGPQPDNVVVAPYIPQTELLSRCAAVVSHSGSGTFLAALSLGLPHLCIPQAADQFENAAAAARSGAGVVLAPGSVTVQSVREGLRQVLDDPSYRAAAQRLSAEIDAMPAPTEVAGVLADRFGAS
ncbi:MAG TPA: glycosyltransferase [Acidimicrobiales bacterium]